MNGHEVNTMFCLNIGKQFFTLSMESGRGDCPESLWCLHTWWYLKAIWTWSWATNSRSKGLRQGDLERSLPASNILCDSVKTISSENFCFQNVWVIELLKLRDWIFTLQLRHFIVKPFLDSWVHTIWSSDSTFEVVGLLQKCCFWQISLWFGLPTQIIKHTRPKLLHFHWRW